MFTKEDIRQIEERGAQPSTVEAQVERFKTGFPWMDIVAPATPGKGITVLTPAQEDEAVAYYESAEIEGKCKFVPASGAASRMFKDIFAGLATLEAGDDVARESAVAKLAARIEEFAFFSPEIFGTPADSKEFRKTAAAGVLNEPGLGYGSKPKGVIRFHRYADETRTAFAEHLVEAQDYMRNADDTANLVVTISPEHRSLFEQALAEVKEKFEKRYGVRYNVNFTYQDKATDTVAVDTENKPFRKEDGSLLFRPAGHGALIYNLNKVEDEIVSIKNIDNVAHERLLPTTARYKKVLLGKCLELRDRVRGYIFALDQIASVAINPELLNVPAYNAAEIDPFATPEAQELCQEIEDFLCSELCITIPEVKTCRERAEALRAKLDRPVRVCGMVRNQGEPGGGPFIIRGKDGSTNLQILESVQINPDDPAAQAALAGATHFNPVDLVCCLRDGQGRKYNLLDFVDDEAGFISSKSYQGRELKALELPGLWNGSMSDWNTLFVEVPLETFNPVKVVLDLLRPAHQA